MNNLTQKDQISDQIKQAEGSLLQEFQSISNQLKNLVSKSVIIEEELGTIMSRLSRNIKDIIYQGGQQR